jgi:hypothetical protein
MEQKRIGNYLIEVDYDDSPRNPREDDNITTMICFHKRYDLGDKHDLKSSQFDSWNEVIDYINENYKVLTSKFLHLYDHSGITISTSSFNDRFDSGIVGIVFIDEKSCKSMMGEVITDEEKLSSIIEAEVKTYDTYIRGEVYGYRVYKIDTCNLGHEHKEEVESCWGYYGEDECMQEAESIVEYLISKEQERVIQ